jgi:hypothetical protein
MQPHFHHRPVGRFTKQGSRDTNTLKALINVAKGLGAILSIL